MSFRYFIVFCYKNKEKFGFGNEMIECDIEIDSAQTIREVEEEICKTNKLDEVTIMNWRKLK